MHISQINSENFYSFLKNSRKTIPNYEVMYSSYLGGVVTDPLLMVLPVDDHIVHRGDGVFEAIRICDSKMFDWKGHWRRLNHSASQIQLEIPVSEIQILKILKAMHRQRPVEQGIIRLYVSRGPGGFTANPYESEKPHLHIVFTPFSAIAESVYDKGVSIQPSRIPSKSDPWHQIKSCNYLPNVLTKKEALDAGVDFCISVNPQGYLGEGPTENIAIIKEGQFLAPPFEWTLAGTTLQQVMSLAEKNLADLGLNRVGFQKFTAEDLQSAEEVFMIGTTLEVLSVTQWKGRKIGSGRAGAKSKKLRELLKALMKGPAQVSLQESY